MTETTVVHLMRHGEVHNPSGVLYGRLADYHLSDLGRKMADRVAEYVTGRDIVHLVSSPLERAQETMEPIAAVGSGDAFLAGFAAARFDGRPPQECLRLAVACGAESTQHFGAGTIDPQEVERIAARVEVTTLDAPAAVR